MTKEIAFEDNTTALIVYPDKYGFGARILVGYLCVFEFLANGKWQFNPKRLSIEPSDRDKESFHVSMEILRVIVVNEPFSLPLDECNGCGNCCLCTPQLTPKEVEKISTCYGEEAIDFFLVLSKLRK